MTTTTERDWAFNTKRLQITLGICGAAQAGSFMNATLQPASAKGDDGEYLLDFSVAMHVEVPESIRSEEQLADYLGTLFSDIVDQHPEVSVEIQLGPFDDPDE